MSSPPASLAVWTNISQDLKRDFNEWYNREHMPERIPGVEGLMHGRRFVAYQGGLRYVALYEPSGVATLLC